MKNIQIGTTIFDGTKKEYLITKLISNSGGFASVFLAEESVRKTKYAVKVVRDFSNETILLGMKNEFEMAKKVDSIHAIKYFYFNELGQNDFPCYIIMEYANGGTLFEEINKRVETKHFYDNSELQKVMYQLIECMVDISEKIVHRDIKPENILLCDEIFKIGDYGIAKEVNAETRRADKTLKGCRSCLYYAPEAWSNQKGTNKIQMDMYAMGIVFYQLANLRYPYSIDWDYPTENDIMRAHVNGTINPFEDYLDSTIVSLIRKMLSKRSQDRFETWIEIRDLLLRQMKFSNRNSFVMDLLNQENKRAESIEKNKRKEQEKNMQEQENFLRYMAQINESIYSPIEEICRQYNQISTDTKYVLSELEPEEDRYINFELQEPNGNKIRFEFEAISMKYYKSRKSIPLVNDVVPYNQQSFEPRFASNKILLWGAIQSDCGLGFNILLNESKDSLYGDMKILSYYSIIKDDLRRVAIPLIKLKHESDNLFRNPRYRIECIDFSFDEIKGLIKINGQFEKNAFKMDTHSEIRFY